MPLLQLFVRRAFSMSEYSLDEFIPLIREVIDSGGEFRLCPKGTSMLPLLRQGIDSVALVAPRKFKRGDILLYQRANGQYVLHRLVRMRRDGSLWFSGDNHMTREKGIDRKQIIASVAAVYRVEKRKERDAFGMRLYAKMMTFSLCKGAVIFVRRVERFLFNKR